MKVFKKSLIALVALSAITISTAGIAKKPSERVTIYDAAQAVEDMSGEFSVLNLALSLNPGIETVLDGRGQFTVFAPTDAAFESLAAIIEAEPFCYGSVVELALAEPDYLTEVLLYHVAKGRMDSTEVLPKTQIRMLSGEFLSIEELTDPPIFDAVDVATDNGIIHIISQVLLPSLPPSNCE
jgi:transforming growth factor-beta-induced protein